MIINKYSKYQNFIKLLPIIFDFLFIFIALKLANYLYQISTFRYNEIFPSYSTSLLIIFSGIVLLFLFMTSSYKRYLMIYNIDEEVKIVRASIFSVFAFIILEFITKQIFLNRLFILYSIILLIIFILISRRIYHLIIYYFHSKGHLLSNTIIYGAGEVGIQLFNQFKRLPQVGYRIIGFIDDTPKRGSSNPYNVLGQFSDLEEIIEKFNVSEVIMAMPSASSQRIIEIIKVCRMKKIKYRFVPNLFKLNAHLVNFDQIGNMPLFSYREVKYTFFETILKRIFDFIFSLIILIITSPICLLVSLLIKFDSKGSILFKHERVGKNGKLFTIYKFRTMYIDTSKYDYCPQKSNDSRITKFGRFLRKTSIDEFPQFLNVLKGDMSVVGPRPEMPFIVEQYEDIHRERLKVNPGITGFWQISKYRSQLIHENIELDLYYIYNQSFILDLVIIIKTIFFAMKGI
ncbi:MAG: sugar transferase [Candidatus Cloacimonetes bacterium]|nr:sugar transferase [Candidatus Cloacimonadota bacterium]